MFFKIFDHNLRLLLNYKLQAFYPQIRQSVISSQIACYRTSPVLAFAKVHKSKSKLSSESIRDVETDSQMDNDDVSIEDGNITLKRGKTPEDKEKQKLEQKEREKKKKETRLKQLEIWKKREEKKSTPKPKIIKNKPNAKADNDEDDDE